MVAPAIAVLMELLPGLLATNLDFQDQLVFVSLLSYGYRPGSSVATLAQSSTAAHPQSNLHALGAAAVVVFIYDPIIIWLRGFPQSVRAQQGIVECSICLCLVVAFNKMEADEHLYIFTYKITNMLNSAPVI